MPTSVPTLRAGEYALYRLERSPGGWTLRYILSTDREPHASFDFDDSGELARFLDSARLTYPFDPAFLLGVLV